jgi:hypothetical protein
LFTEGKIHPSTPSKRENKTTTKIRSHNKHQRFEKQQAVKEFWREKKNFFFEGKTHFDLKTFLRRETTQKKKSFLISEIFTRNTHILIKIKET